MKNELSKCIESLKGVRCAIHDDVDPSIRAALDEVIHDLESCLGSDNEPCRDWSRYAEQGMELVSRILLFWDLIDRFRS